MHAEWESPLCLARKLREDVYCERRKHGIFGLNVEVWTSMYFTSGEVLRRRVRPQLTHSPAFSLEFFDNIQVYPVVQGREALPSPCVRQAATE